MGILNVTPDSFSDGGLFFSTEAALRRAEAMVEEGAAIIDVGGESTRPGAQPVPLEEELRRVIPVIRALKRRLSIPISIDTRKPEVMRRAVEAGASMINDVCALRAPGALETAAALKVPVCLMHMKGEPSTMQENPVYGDVVEEVKGFLEARMEACLKAGIPRERMAIDPGFGFGKTFAHNRALFQGLERLQALGVPLLVGVSRKSMIARVLDKPPEERLYGSLALAALAVMKGASIIRAHDVSPTVDAVKMAHAVKGG
ncbi:MAG: dihydropteroate synthase [Gammaproteobacteria bacterium]|nr:MAG: dihydropteroate synthase [Gammaproteobacteria bacterium]